VSQEDGGCVDKSLELDWVWASVLDMSANLAEACDAPLVLWLVGI
jgi:hypothetical protein